MLPAFAAIALGTPTLIGLAVWAVVRSGDRTTPTPEPGETTPSYTVDVKGTLPSDADIDRLIKRMRGQGQ